MALESLTAREDAGIPDALERTTGYMEHPVFHKYRSETEMLRYMKEQVSDQNIIVIADGDHQHRSTSVHRVGELLPERAHLVLVEVGHCRVPRMLVGGQHPT